MSDLQGSAELMRRFEALRTGKANRAILGQFGTLAVQYARGLVPQKTRNLHRTIRVGDIDVAGQSVQVIAGGRRSVGYAAHVEFGTRPHIIRPKRPGGVLAWGGQRRLSGSLRRGSKPTRFARFVNHPGTRPKPYLVPGAKRALGEVGLADRVIETWNRAS